MLKTKIRFLYRITICLENKFNMQSKLTKNQVSHASDPKSWPFVSTSELSVLEDNLGQERAIEALNFGMNMSHDGYHLFAFGSSTLSMREFLVRKLTAHCANLQKVKDWCYVYNFNDPDFPEAIALPVGQGRELRNQMESLIKDLRQRIPALFESADYRDQRQILDSELLDWQKKGLEVLVEEAKNHGLGLKQTATGYVFTALTDDKPMSEVEFDALPEVQKSQLVEQGELLNSRLVEFLNEGINKERELKAKVQQLHKEMVTFSVGHLFNEIRNCFIALPEVVSFLDSVEADVILNADAFHQVTRIDGVRYVRLIENNSFDSEIFGRYRINLFVDNSRITGAPIIELDHPTYTNLVGQIGQVPQGGGWSTNFSLVRAGALQKANSGYLILNAEKILMNSHAWEALKRALRTRHASIEPLVQNTGNTDFSGLRPNPIPLDVKVVLYGSRYTYHLLAQFDSEFSRLFKVPVEFQQKISRDYKAEILFARLVATQIRELNLREFSRDGVASVLDFCLRRGGDATKIFLEIDFLRDVLREADFAAGPEVPIIERMHVTKAMLSRERRHDLVRERLLDDFKRKILVVETSGRRVGQVNGLSMVEQANFVFARPLRITSAVSLGNGEIVDLESLADLGGPIYSKSVLVLTSFMRARYSLDVPFSIAASLGFDQSYTEVEGDSASAAELLALLSAVGEVPLAQNWAVTGTVNAHGEILAVGGVNEKVEGFYDLCQSRILTGDQGVIIPRSNIEHLMLREDVVLAIEQNQFHVVAVDHIDDCIEVLSGMSAGVIDMNGQFPQGSFNFEVFSSLVVYAQTWAVWTKPIEVIPEMNVPENTKHKHSVSH